MVKCENRAVSEINLRWWRPELTPICLWGLLEPRYRLHSCVPGPKFLCHYAYTGGLYHPMCETIYQISCRWEDNPVRSTVPPPQSGR